MHELEIKAVEMVRGIRDAHYEKLKDLSPREKIAFFREKARAPYAELGRPEELLDDSAPAPAVKSGL
ncbi:MAG TPA: hypothetical protein VEW48_05630 [Thermoanaerobaculia bacterium]|nr:hypothetical protein [Thermoanaerobaculia bacterium]